MTEINERPAYTVTIAGALSAADATALIYQLANKLGLPVSMTGADGETFTANPGDKPTKAGKIVMPDEIQAQIIALCSRPNGSNPWELFETVVPKSPRPWGKMVAKIAEDFGYNLTVGVTRWGKKPTDSFHLTSRATHDAMMAAAD